MNGWEATDVRFGGWIESSFVLLAYTLYVFGLFVFHPLTLCHKLGEVLKNRNRAFHPKISLRFVLEDGESRGMDVLYRAKSHSLVLTRVRSMCLLTRHSIYQHSISSNLLQVRLSRYIRSSRHTSAKALLGKGICALAPLE